MSKAQFQYNSRRHAVGPIRNHLMEGFSETVHHSWTTWYILIQLCIILQEMTNSLFTHSFWHQTLINLLAPRIVHITDSWSDVILALPFRFKVVKIQNEAPYRESWKKSNILKVDNIGADYVPGADWSCKHRNPGFIHICSASWHELFFTYRIWLFPVVLSNHIFRDVCFKHPNYGLTENYCIVLRNAIFSKSNVCQK